MKSKNKISLFVGALFFLSVFFVRIDGVKADDCSDCTKAYGEAFCIQEGFCVGAPVSGAEIGVQQAPVTVDDAFCEKNYGNTSYAENGQCVNGNGTSDSYDVCKANGGTTAECASLPGAPTSATNIGDASAGTGNCNFNSDCGTGFTCYQKSCVDDQTYQNNVSWSSRVGNATSQVFTPGGSVISSNGTPSLSTVASTTVPIRTANGTVAAAGTQVMSDGSGRNAAGEEIAPAGTFQVPSTGIGSNFVMCANGVLAPECRDANGNYINGSPIVLGSSAVGNNSGLPGTSNSTGSSAGKCGNGFQEISGVCFPTTTGLSSASIYDILANLFSWLMGLFTTFAVIAFVVSGIQYFMAAGDEGMAETAKHNATYAIVGIIVGLSGFIVIKAIAAALSGTSYLF